MLFLLNFALNIGIASYFAHYKYTSRNKEDVSRYDDNYKTKDY